jgi:hypothetical protein
MKVRVYHAHYGCESGCCGHRVEIPDLKVHEFGFTHVETRDRESAVAMAKEILSDIDCGELDWDQVEIDFEDMHTYGCP